MVEFNAWEYNATERIWPGLVRKVIDEVDHHIPSWDARLWARRAYMRIRRNLAGNFRAYWGHLVVFGAAAAVLVYLLRGGLPSVMGGGKKPAVDFKLIQAIAGAVAATLSLFVGTIVTPLGNWVAAMAGSRQRYGVTIDYMSAIHDDLSVFDSWLRNGAPAQSGDDGKLDSDVRREAAQERAKRRRARGAREGRVLIVIDDLDRCEPEKAVEVLQSINLLLNFDSFIVCMGIDARVITGAVEKHYQDLLGPAGISGYEYLDKIIQIPFRIPEPSEDDLEEFLAQQLARREPVAHADAPR